MRIGINGLGRIGRQVFRIAHAHEHLEIVHVNDVTNANVRATLLQFDATHGHCWQPVHAEGDALHIAGRTISVGAEMDPTRLPWREKGVDVVLESTGAFRTRAHAAKHLQAGAHKVLISAPGKGPLDANIILGVNEDHYDRHRHHVISIGSCTTNCLAPIAKVVHEELRIRYGFINTVHPYTASQNLLDGLHATTPRGRAAVESVVPTSTGAVQMIDKVIPDLEGKLDGFEVQIHVKCGSLLDLTCTVERETSPHELNDAFRSWAEGPMKGILAVEDGPLVSSDVIGAEHSAIVSARDTHVIGGGRFLKVLAWYDDEWGFSRRCVDMMARML